MGTLSILLIAVYWVIAVLSVLGVGSITWLVSRSMVVTMVVSGVWCWVSLFGIYRVVVSHEV
jgi:hypothetical protein